MSKTTLSVSAIKDGTVIDHVRAGSGLRIVRLLDMAANDAQVTLGLNLKSKTQKRKDIIKVHGRELSEEEANRVAILAPNATINIIRGYEIVHKFQVIIPPRIAHIIICPNSTCITNNEQMDTDFIVRTDRRNMQFQCAYCERIFDEEDIKEYRK